MSTSEALIFHSLPLKILNADGLIDTRKKKASEQVSSSRW
jgi:hypothetical protein